MNALTSSSYSLHTRHVTGTAHTRHGTERVWVSYQHATTYVLGDCRLRRLYADCDSLQRSCEDRKDFVNFLEWHLAVHIPH
jgi:hypothetical protein